MVKTRFEVIGFNEYTSVWDGVRKIMAKEGPRGFYTGLQVSLIRDLPFSGLYYPLYEESKTAFAFLLGMDYLSEHSQNNKSQLLLLTALAATNANVLSCVITHPIDIIRTRILFRFYAKDPNQNDRGVSDAVFKIYRYEGMRGFFRGLTPRIL